MCPDYHFYGVSYFIWNCEFYSVIIMKGSEVKNRVEQQNGSLKFVIPLPRMKICRMEGRFFN